MAKVVLGWAPFLSELTAGMAYFMEKPKSVFDTHEKGHNHRYNRCPATLETMRNTFIIRAPFDLHFTVDANARHMETIPPTNVPAEFFLMRGNEYGENDEPIMSLNAHQLLLAECEDIEVLVTPPWFEKDINQQFRIVPGRFKISDWWRPLDIAFQLNSRVQEVKIRAGDPLMYINIRTGNPEDVVVLKEIEVTPELRAFMKCAVEAKFYQPKCPLKTLYNAFNSTKARGHRPKLKFME